MKYRPCDKVRIIANKNGHQLGIGDEVFIVDQHCSGVGWLVSEDDPNNDAEWSNVDWFVTDEEIEPVTFNFSLTPLQIADIQSALECWEEQCFDGARECYGYEGAEEEKESCEAAGERTSGLIELFDVMSYEEFRKVMGQEK